MDEDTQQVFGLVLGTLMAISNTLRDICGVLRTAGFEKENLDAIDERLAVTKSLLQKVKTK